MFGSMTGDALRTFQVRCFQEHVVDKFLHLGWCGVWFKVQEEGSGEIGKGHGQLEATVWWYKGYEQRRAWQFQ